MDIYAFFINSIDEDNKRKNYNNTLSGNILNSGEDTFEYLLVKDEKYFNEDISE